MVCLVAMLAIDVFAGLIALVLMFALYRYLRGKEIPVAWADSRPAYNFRKIKETLREIEWLSIEGWNWQPNILIFGEDAERRDLLARFGALFSGASGFTTSVGVVQAEADFMSSIEARVELEETLRDEIESQSLDAFPLAIAAPDLRVAVGTVLQTWGVGPLRANTVLLDWWQQLPETSALADPQRYGRQLRSVLRLGSHVVVLDVTGRDERAVASLEPEGRRIDVWWWEEASCRLGLLLAYMMTRSPEWEESPIRILAPCGDDEQDKTRAHVQAALEQARIEATIETVPDAGHDRMISLCQDSAIVFFRIRIEGMNVVDPFGGVLEELLPGLPITCMVAAAESVTLSEPDEEEADAADRDGEA